MSGRDFVWILVKPPPIKFEVSKNKVLCVLFCVRVVVVY